MGVFEKLERDILNVRTEAAEEIVRVLKEKGYGPKDVATSYGQNDIKAWSIMYGKYGNGVIVANAQNGRETHIDNLSTDDVLDVLVAALHVWPNTDF